MILLFRKLRQRLLTENRLTGYLLYALGEILLVVIGILIALQVNNWNESRQERSRANKFLAALQDDLVRDTTLIQTALKWSIKDSTLLGEIRRSLSSDDVTRETLISLARYRYDPWIRMRVSFNNNTYVSLQATGALNSLPEALRNALQELNNLQADYTGQITADENLYLSQTIAYSNHFPFNDTGHIDPDSRLADRIWASADSVELATQFNALVGVKYSTYFGHLPELQRILAKSSQILEQLQSPNKNPTP